jgi:hypothetical protein
LQVRTNLAFAPGVHRVLIILSGEIDELSLRTRCVGLASSSAIALCYQLPAGKAGLQEGLHVQRRLTELLRTVMGTAAETIPIFVAADREGERTTDLAEAWGATEVDR